jgi:hypothetical protein
MSVVARTATTTAVSETMIVTVVAAREARTK